MIILATVIFMEPLTAFTHRLIMHGWGWGWHRSHHDRNGSRFEANDYFPIVFSLVAIALFIWGMSASVAHDIAIGVTIYGAIYFLVHEVIIHSRFGKVPGDNILFRYWMNAHNTHHQFQGAPYGFIAPITPRILKKRSLENPRNLIDRYRSQDNSLTPSNENESA